MVLKHQSYFPLRDWDLLAALLPLDGFTFSSFFWGLTLWIQAFHDSSAEDKGLGDLMGREFTKTLSLSCRDYFIALHCIAVSFWRRLPLFFLPTSRRPPAVSPHPMPVHPAPPRPARVRVLRQAPCGWIPPPLSPLSEPWSFLPSRWVQLIWSCHGNILATVLFYRKAW